MICAVFFLAGMLIGGLALGLWAALAADEPEDFK